MIKVLVVDDSASVSLYLSEIFSSDPELTVIGAARNGMEAVQMAAQLKPDIVSMDINMPDIDGFEATRRIMEVTPMPIVIVSSIYDEHAVTLSFKALEAGALAIVDKPPSIMSPDFTQKKQHLLFLLKAMAGVKVVQRRAKVLPSRLVTASNPIPEAQCSNEIRIIAIGASTGGPQAIQEILNNLSFESLHKYLPPVVIVQHITPGFETGLAGWLNLTSILPVRLAENNVMLQPNVVYIAPAKMHVEVTRDQRILLIPGPAEHGVCPSVSRLFRSVLTAYGRNAVGVLLSGMGVDGAAELKALRDCGAVTIAQNKDTSVVHGMPGEAIRLGGACHVLPLDAIAPMLRILAGIEARIN